MESCSSTPVLLPDQFSGVLGGRQLVRELVTNLSTTVPIVPKCKPQLIVSIGSAAAALMAKFGVVPSRGAYAYLQSSAMGGYGSALVQGVTRAGSAVFGASQWLNSYLHGWELSKANDTARVESSREGGVEVDEPAEMKAKL